VSIGDSPESWGPVSTIFVNRRAFEVMRARLATASFDKGGTNPNEFAIGAYAALYVTDPTILKLSGIQRAAEPSRGTSLLHRHTRP
jgi:hypothetical protein